MNAKQIAQMRRLLSKNKIEVIEITQYTVTCKAFYDDFCDIISPMHMDVTVIGGINGVAPTFHVKEFSDTTRAASANTQGES